MTTSYPDDPASHDGIRHSHIVVATHWRPTLLHGVHTVATAGRDPYNPHKPYGSRLTCSGQITTPDTIGADAREAYRTA
jgi:hypothetical protein